MDRSPVLPITAILISLAITIASFTVLYYQQSEQHKSRARLRLNNHAQQLVETFDRHFSDLNLMLQNSGSVEQLCTEQDWHYSDSMLARPEIVGVQVLDAHGYLRCDNGKLLSPAPHVGKPDPRFGLRFVGPRLINHYDRPVLMLARTRTDGSAIQVILHPGWLRNRMRQLTSSLGFVALIDSDSGVPVLDIGAYSLPQQHDLFPLNHARSTESQFDNNRHQYLYALPLLTQPSLSLIISEESVLLNQPLTVFTTQRIFLAALCFMVALFLTLKIQRSLSDPARQLRAGMRQQQFINLYQPLVRSEDFSLAGVEVLMRWQHPDGMRSPDTFIPAAEATGLIREMTLQQLKRITDELASILATQPSFRVNVNICPPIINDPDTVDSIIRYKKQIPGLVLEITENQMLEECEVTAQSLQRFRDAGIHIAIDDFGTGYCGLSYLSQLPLSILKADRCFVAAMGTDAVNAHLLETIQQLAKKLNLSTVAEGVEEASQALKLQAMGIEIQQGWYHGRPMSPEQIYARWLDSQQQLSSNPALAACYG